MKYSRNPLIACIFQGKSSGRREHLKTNKKLVALTRFFSILITLAATASLIHPDTKPLGILFFSEAFPYILFIPCFIRWHEVWAGPDRDIATNDAAGRYWSAYESITRHRGVLSHTLTLGTPLRFILGYLPIILVAIGLINFGMIHEAIELKENFSMIEVIGSLEIPRWFRLLLFWWYVSCLLSDLMHFLTDRMNPAGFLLKGDP